jgi:anti-anti-sigma factor
MLAKSAEPNQSGPSCTNWRIDWRGLRRTGPANILRQSASGDLQQGSEVEIGESRIGGCLVLRPVGRLDNATSTEFQPRLLQAVTAGAADVIIDLGAVEYVSSAGLRTLMTASKMKPRGRRLAVTGLRALVEEVFAISRFHHVIAVFGSVDEAVAEWQRVGDPAEVSESDPVADASIPVRFWGTRGSLSAPLDHNAVREKIRQALLTAVERGLADPEHIDAFIERELPFSVRGTFGGNTSCVEIGGGGGDDYLLCDLGTGVREFGNRVIAERGSERPHCFNVFMSHVHWDHIMGFPFFAPAYIPGNRIRIHGCHKVLREAMQRQQSAPCFPVPFGSLAATIEFIELEPGIEYRIGGFSVSAIRQFHEGDSYGYRFSRGGKSIVYSTDCEHKASVLDQSYPFVKFFGDADLLIFDSMYSLAETVSVKEDWGHSSNIVAVELAQLARVKRLVLFHHEPAYDDFSIERVLRETTRYEEISRDGHQVEVISAYDGLELLV